MKDAETIRREFEVCCATVEVLHRTSTVGRSKAPSLPIKALSFCRPTELRAERWYAVPKGDETAGLGGFLGLTGPMGRRVLKFDGAFGPEGCGGGFAAGCVEGLHRFAQGATAASPLRVADCRSAAMLIKSALRELTFCVIRHDKHSADWLAALATPYPAAPDFSTGKRVTRFSGRFASLRIVFPCHPYAGGRIKHREKIFS